MVLRLLRDPKAAGLDIARLIDFGASPRASGSTLGWVSASRSKPVSAKRYPRRSCNSSSAAVVDIGSRGYSMVMNRRSQRMSVGHRQMSQKLPPSMENHRISARPTMFSSGT